MLLSGADAMQESRAAAPHDSCKPARMHRQPVTFVATMRAVTQGREPIALAAAGLQGLQPRSRFVRQGRLELRSRHPGQTPVSGCTVQEAWFCEAAPLCRLQTAGSITTQLRF
jgi:hypothetical protein